MKSLEEIVLDEFKKKGIEVTLVSNNVYGIACHIDTTEYDKKIMEEVIDDKLQEFAQWLWDSHYLVDEAFTIRLVEQYKTEKLKEQVNEKNTRH